MTWLDTVICKRKGAMIYTTCFFFFIMQPVYGFVWHSDLNECKTPNYPNFADKLTKRTVCVETLINIVHLPAALLRLLLLFYPPPRSISFLTDNNVKKIKIVWLDVFAYHIFLPVVFFFEKKPPVSPGRTWLISGTDWLLNEVENSENYNYQHLGF